jgi:glucokinase
MPPEQGSPLVLLADIGGTNARFALARADEIGPIATLRTTEHEDAGAAIRAFLDRAQLSSPPQTAALACAGPVENGRVQLTNSDWHIDAEQVCSELGFEDVILVNDFASVAWAIPRLRETDLQRIGGGQGLAGAPSVALGPGTGLGVAGFLSNDGEDVVIGGEGGHVSMPCVTDREAAVLADIRKGLGHVSAERLLSGDGLVRLYNTVARLDGLEAPQRSPAEITDAATAEDGALCRAAFDMFCEMLGTVAGDLALTFGARGGVYIAGGIVPKAKEAFANSRFRQRFEAKGRFRDYLAQIPTWIVTHPEPAFLGLMRVLRGTASRP